MSREELAQFLFESFRKVYEGTETFTKSTISWGHIAAELQPEIQRLLAAEREKIAVRLRHVADGYEQGGHTHRARAFRAVADEVSQ